jgi:hypothetical protein
MPSGGTTGTARWAGSPDWLDAIESALFGQGSERNVLATRLCQLALHVRVTVVSASFPDHGLTAPAVRAWGPVRTGRFRLIRATERRHRQAGYQLLTLQQPATLTPFYEPLGYLSDEKKVRLPV